MPGCPHTAATQIPHLPHCFLDSGRGGRCDDAAMTRRRRGDVATSNDDDEATRCAGDARRDEPLQAARARRRGDEVRIPP